MAEFKRLRVKDVSRGRQAKGIFEFTTEEIEAIRKSLELYCDVSRGKLESTYSVLKAHEGALIMQWHEAKRLLRDAAWKVGMTLDNRALREGPYATNPIAETAQKILDRLP